MASSRVGGRSPAEQLFDPELACSFDPFQALRLLELLANQHDLRASTASWQPIEQAVKLRSHVSLAFPPSLIAGVVPPAGHPLSETLTREAERIRHRYSPGAVPTVVCAFFGLFGPHGALPIGYTQRLCELEADRDLRRTSTRTVLRDWLDLFNHRLIALLFRAWQKYRMPTGYLRATWRRGPTAHIHTDKVTEVLFSLVGLGSPAHRNRQRLYAPVAPGHVPDDEPLVSIDDRALLRFAGAFARRRPGAFELQGLLTGYFGVNVQVVPFSGQWLKLPEAEQTRLIDDGVTGQLGRNAVAGERVWDPASKFRLRIGPLKLLHSKSEDAPDAFVAYLPDPTPIRQRKAAYLLSQLVRTYVGMDLDFEIQLVLPRDQVPECRMQDVPEGSLGLRLGWNTWLKDDQETTMPDEIDDVLFDGICEQELPTVEG